MQPITPFNLREKVTAAITESRSELWFPHLTYDLVQTGWQRLREEVELDEFDYGTARVILKDVDTPRDLLYTLLFKNSEEEVKDTIFIEKLPDNIADQYKISGVDFYGLELILSQRVDRNTVLDCLAQAFDIIKQIPTLFRTVIDLVRCIHLIKPESDDYDTSFSEPHIPFSIFISVPQENILINALRVAEAIVHEAMHLQLTLIEENSSLFQSNKKLYYSPWKDEFRSPQGLLHALYVFRVINNFLCTLPRDDTKTRTYVTLRSKEINLQINSIKDFVEHNELTLVGKVFVKNLIKNQN